MSVNVVWFPDYGHIVAGIFICRIKYFCKGENKKIKSFLGSVNQKNFFCEIILSKWKPDVIKLEKLSKYV